MQSQPKAQGKTLRTFITLPQSTKELKVFPNSNCLCLIIHQAYNTTGFIMFRYNKLPRTNLVNNTKSLKRIT